MSTIFKTQEIKEDCSRNNHIDNHRKRKDEEKPSVQNKVKENKNNEGGNTNGNYKINDGDDGDDDYVAGYKTFVSANLASSRLTTRTNTTGEYNNKGNISYCENFDDEDDQYLMNEDEYEAPKEQLIDFIIAAKLRESNRSFQEINKNEAPQSKHQSTLDPRNPSDLVYLIKWKNRSYLHVEWVDRQMIEEDGTSGKLRLSRFLQNYDVNRIINNSKSSSTGESEEFFDPSFTEVERILDASKNALLNYVDGDYSEGLIVDGIRKPAWKMKKEVMQVNNKLLNLRREYFKISTYFMEPVDEDRDGAPGYYELVKKPMCFNIIRSKIMNEEYKSVEEYGSDIRLIFQACELYNTDPLTMVRQCSKWLSEAFEPKYKALLSAEAKYEEEALNPPETNAEGKDNNGVSDNDNLYLVKWKGLSYADATWEREEHILDDNAIASYFRRNNFDVRRARGETDAISEYYRTSKQTPTNYKQSPIFKNNLTLRSYQVEGLNWLAFNHGLGRGCILADEMGLGKTCQTVAFVRHIHENIRNNIHKKRPCLVVAPLSTLGHWKNEFERWTDLNCIIYHDVGGNGKRGAGARADIRSNEFFLYENKRIRSKGKAATAEIQRVQLANVWKFDVIVTSYEVMTVDAEFLSAIHFACVIVDEGQRLKSNTSKLARTFRDHIKADTRVLLSGTPLQNNVGELWALLNFVQNDAFPSQHDFVAEFGSMESSKEVEKLQTRIKPYLLRRLKEDVEKDIPAKEETVIDVELTILQKKYYRAIYERNREFLSVSVGGKSGSMVTPQLINIETELRKCCNHPYLVKGVEDRETSQFHLDHPEAGVFSEQALQHLVQASGKMVLLDKLLAKFRAEKRKVLIFSQFKIMLDIISDYCVHKERNYPFERIDGNVPGNLRQKAIDRFQDATPGNEKSSFLFLLSTRAGGVGINLVAADTVIIFDSDWNPQNDLQAMARCHRIGQKKAVMVYRLVTRDTYESRLFEIAARKLGLEQAVLGKDTDMGKALGKDQIESLLKHGAYRLLETDEESEKQSKEYCETDIDDLLARDSRKVDWGKLSSAKSNEDGSNGSLNFSKASFVSADTDLEVNINDPTFWTKVLGEDSRSTLINRLADGSAYETEEKKNAFFKELYSTGEEVIQSKLQGTVSPPFEDQVLDSLQMITNMKRTFSSEEQERAKNFHGQVQRPSRRRAKQKESDDEDGIDDDDDEEDVDKKISGRRRKRSKFNEDEMQKVVVIGKKEIDVEQLAILVADFGGFQRVSRNRLWPKIRDALGINKKNTSSATQLRVAHEKHCQHFNFPEKNYDEEDRLQEEEKKNKKKKAKKKKENDTIEVEEKEIRDDGVIRIITKNHPVSHKRRSEGFSKSKKPRNSDDTDDQNDTTITLKKPKKVKKPAVKKPEVPIELLDPAIYPRMTLAGEHWCRYCGATETSNFSRSPWGSSMLCIPHYVQWFQKKSLKLDAYKEVPTQPINPMANTQFKYIAWKKEKALKLEKMALAEGSNSNTSVTTSNPYEAPKSSITSKSRRSLID